jgi:hypothetical protein
VPKFQENDMPRDSSGVYTLPPGNPVVDGTVIETTWANPTMQDIAAQLNNVLTRDGVLGPTQPFLAVDGTVAAPGLTFASDPDTGLYRPAINTMGIAAGGVEAMVFNPAGIAVSLPMSLADTLDVTGDTNLAGALNVLGLTTLTGALNVLGLTTFAGNIIANGAVTLNGLVNLVGAANIALALGTAPLPSLHFIGDLDTGLYSPGADQVALSTAGLQRLLINSAGGVRINQTSAGDSLVVTAFPSAFAISVYGVAATNPALISFNETGVRAWYMGAGISATNMFGLADNTRGAYIWTVNQLGNFVMSAAVSGATLFLSGAGYIGAANYVISTQATTDAGTFGFFNGNGPSIATYGTAAGGGLAGSVLFTVPTFIQFSPSSANGVRYNFPAGGYAQYLNATVGGIGYIGTASALMGGTGNELGIRAETILRLISGGGIGLWSLGATGIMTAEAPSVAASNLLLKGNASGAEQLDLRNSGANGAAILFEGPGAVTPNKWIRVVSGELQVVNSAYSGVPLVLTDAGALTLSGVVPLNTNSQQVATTVYVNANSLATHIRNWNNMGVSGTRTLGGVTTSPDFPIEISINFAFPATSGTNVLLNVGGITVCALSNGTAGAYAENITVVIPPNTTYQITNTVGTPTINSWFELR